ncbi:MAG: hypothetical protein HKP38_07345 [Croceitalea sp.]|nr:hypothetical protein [Croceitalea sp.]MBT8238453.1 hypothetical protein [Croceitalea sp.]NNC34199.1 hypothetical protein [Croceitalea sp.]NNL09021.1 hypothetical protein [Croceitalea sp.]NNM18747.1 hypothetical protein [Croceitalea sp.]
MKTILLLLTVCISSLALGSCTNDEGEDIDIITPKEEEKSVQDPKNHQD